MAQSLQQIAESYIPDPSTAGTVDSKREIATALMHTMPWSGEDYTVQEVHAAICDRVEQIRNR